MSKAPFNPLDKLSLARGLARALLENPCERLPPQASFPGAGIYVIYYSGKFPLYEKIASLNRAGKFAVPIYAGKAVSEGARKGALGKEPGTALFRRLREHAKSIEQVKNLDAADFRCRYLVVDDIWIPLGEQLLIEAFSPLWNVALDGFGIHHPGGPRSRQQRSTWDTLHPGRPWADHLPPNKRSPAQIEASVQEFLTGWKVKDEWLRFEPG
jgi:hypothetical protein